MSKYIVTREQLDKDIAEFYRRSLKPTLVRPQGVMQTSYSESRTVQFEESAKKAPAEKRKKPVFGAPAPPFPEIYEVVSTATSILLKFYSVKDPATGNDVGTLYNVYRNDVGTGSFTLIAGNITGGSGRPYLEYLDTTGLVPDHDYYYIMSSVGLVGEGPTSPVKAARTVGLAPPPPFIPASFVISSTSVKLFWNTVIDPATGLSVAKYNLFRNNTGVPGGFFNIARLIPGNVEGTNVRSFVDNLGNDLSNRDVYYVASSTGLDGDGPTGPVQTVHIPVHPVPGRPTITDTDHGVDNITLHWDPVEDPVVHSSTNTNYFIRRNIGGGPFELIAAGLQGLTQFTDLHRAPNTDHGYYMSAGGIGGEGLPSTPVKIVRTDPGTPPAPPRIDLTKYNVDIFAVQTTIRNGESFQGFFHVRRIQPSTTPVYNGPIYLGCEDISLYNGASSGTVALNNAVVMQGGASTHYHNALVYSVNSEIDYFFTFQAQFTSGFTSGFMTFGILTEPNPGGDPYGHPTAYNRRLGITVNPR